MKIIISKIVLMTTFLVLSSCSEKSDSLQEIGADAVKGLNKAGRDIKDETCELINGKMECAKDKVVHGVENAVDEVEDKVEDVTNGK